MNWADLDKEKRKVIETILTPKQLEIVRLLNQQPGVGTNTLARQLGIDRKSAKDRLDAAERKILRVFRERGWL